MYAVTGASGQLGRHVLDTLLETVSPAEIVALVRDPAKLADVAAKGVTVRAFDYDAPGTLAAGLEGVDRLLLISANEVGKREPQHRAVIEAAKAAEVGFIAYTSILRADTNPMKLAAEHLATERLLSASGIAAAFLRNGWYVENYYGGAAAGLVHGAVVGSAADGRISAASRADYAAAAVAVLTAPEVAAAVYELAGDDAFTMAEFAAALSDISGKTVGYTNLPEADYAKVLEGVGLPAPFAAILADSDAQAGHGALFDDSHTLSGLIGRPTTPWREVLAAGV